MCYQKCKVIALIALAFSLPALAVEPPEPVSPQKYINVSVELHGLDESAQLVKDASLALANKVKQIEIQPEKMSAEQLAELSGLMKEANTLVQSFEGSLNQAAPAIENLRGTANNVVTDTFTTLYNSTLEPALESVDSSVSKWIVLVFIGFFLLLMVVGYCIYLSARQMRAMALVLKSITEDYEIVRRQPQAENSEQPIGE